MEYGNVFVDEAYSAIVEPNLYGNSIFQPGITYDDTYQGNATAGVVKIYKTVRDGKHGPSTPAGDFNHENAANTLISVMISNAFRKSKKIYAIAANAVPYALAEETLSTAVQDNGEDRQRAGLACLVYEGTDFSDYTAITASNIKSYTIAVRKALRKKHAKPDIVIASVDVYSAMLEAAGTQYTPNTNENTLTTGRVGTWLGMSWYEGDLLDAENATYYDYAAALQETDLTDVDFIMYDHKALKIIDVTLVNNLVDGQPAFAGTYAQNEINSGYRVSDSDMVYVKKNASLDALTVTSVAGQAVGNTQLSVTPSILDGNSYKYKANASTAPAVTYDQVLTTGWTAWDGSAEITVATGYKLTLAEVDGNNKAKRAGNVTVTSKAGT